MPKLCEEWLGCVQIPDKIFVCDPDYPQHMYNSSKVSQENMNQIFITLEQIFANQGN